MYRVINSKGFDTMVSKNLRCVMRYHASVSPIVLIKITYHKHSGGCDFLAVYFDGSTFETTFTSYVVCEKWIGRKRSLGPIQIVYIHADDDSCTGEDISVLRAEYICRLRGI